MIKMEEKKEVMEIKQRDVDSSDQDPYPRTWLIYYSFDHDILGSSKKGMILFDDAHQRLVRVMTLTNDGDNFQADKKHYLTVT